MKDNDGHEAARAERLRVFLCHSSDDKTEVRKLYWRLRSEGFQPWLDEENLLVGQEWQREIEKAVRASHVVIVCLSQNSVSKAGYVQKEILVALEAAERQPPGTNFILPVKLEPCEIPERLHTRHCANFFEKDGYARLTKALWAYATERALFTPEPRAEVDAGGVSKSEADEAEVTPRPPSRVPVHPRLSSMRPRAEVPKAGSRNLPRSGAAALFIAFAVIMGLGLRNYVGEKAKELVQPEMMRPGPVLRPEPRAEKTPEPSRPTPTPAEPQAEVGPDEEEKDPPPVSPGDSTPPAPRSSSSLSRYRVDIFLTRRTYNQKGFAEEIGRHLKQHVRAIKFPPKPFKAVMGCQVRYLYAGKGDPLNEDAAAAALVKQLKDAYPNASFQGKAVTDRDTENIMTLVIGSGCKK